MVIEGWKFDFESLPYWNNRRKIPLITDDFFESETSDVACIIYSIAEAGMCNYVGFLAILKNKSSPTLFLNIININFPKQEVSFNSTGNLIFLQTHIYNKAINQTECPIIIIDTEKNSFSYVRTNNCNPCYKIVEQKYNVFRIEADEFQRKNDKRLKAFSNKKIRLDRLKWYGIQDIINFPTKYFNNI